MPVVSMTVYISAMWFIAHSLSCPLEPNPVGWGTVKVGKNPPGCGLPLCPELLGIQEHLAYSKHSINIHQANEDISSISHRLLYSSLPNNPKLVHVQSCQALCNRYIPWTETHLDCPWNFPEKNIGMGCHSLLETTL